MTVAGALELILSISNIFQKSEFTENLLENNLLVVYRPSEANSYIRFKGIINFQDHLNNGSYKSHLHDDEMKGIELCNENKETCQMEFNLKDDNLSMTNDINIPNKASFELEDGTRGFVLDITPLLEHK